MKDVVNLDLSPYQSERELILGQLICEITKKSGIIDYK